MPGLRRINHTKSDPRTRRGLAILAQEAELIFGDGLETGPIDGISGGSLITIALATPSGLVKDGGLAIDPKSSGGMAIDTSGLYIVLDTPAHGKHLSLGASGLSIDDDYVFNTGDSMTGALVITTTATQLTLNYDGSNDATFTVGATGDLTIAASGGDISFGDDRLQYQYGNWMDPSIVAWWEFLNTAEDKSLEGNDATLSGASLTTEPGVLYLDGINDSATLDADSSLDITGPITISAWVLLDTGTHNAEILLGAYSPVSFDGYGVMINANKMNYWSSLKGAWAIANTAINDNKWHHIVVSVSGTTASFFLDGVADGTPASNQPGSWNGAKRIGADTTPANYFDGLVSDLMIFNRALTVDEVNKLYSAQSKHAVNATYGEFADDVGIGGAVGVTGSLTVGAITISYFDISSSTGDITVTSAMTIDNVRIDTNTISTTSGDLILDCAAGNIVFSTDIETDRWLNNDTNLFLGVGVAGDGNLAHTSGVQGWNNIGLGNNTLKAITTGYSNVAIGATALDRNDTGYGNIAIGFGAMTDNQDGYYNVAIGQDALGDNVGGERNVAIGRNAMLKNIDGNDNVGIGFGALDKNEGGDFNFAAGTNALGANVSGSNNFAFGASALFTCNNGVDNIAIGPSAMAALTSSSLNIAIGAYSLYNLTTHGGNVAIGYQAGQYTSTGNYNTFIGHLAGRGTGATAKSRNVFIGNEAGYNETGNDKLYIENTNTATPLIYGEFDNDLVRIYGDLEFIDNNKIKLGTGKDVEVYYNNADLVIDTSIVAASDLNLQCGTDKTLELQETVWKDINIGGVQLARPVASQPSEGNFLDEAGADTGITTLAFSVGEKASGSFEMQHDYKEGTDLVFHVHWQGIAAPSGTDNVQWRLTYTLSRVNTTLDAVTIIDSPDTAFDAQYEFKRTDIVTIDGSTAGSNGGPILIGDQFLFTLERVAATGDAYAGDALIATVGIHYEVDTIGSRQIGTK